MNLSNQPVHTVFNGIKYDSKFESYIAEVLQKFVYEGCSIQQQVKTSIKPGTEVFKERFWKCDFLISYKNNNRLIEAKGFVDPTLKFQMEMFEYFHKENFKTLLIVTPRHFKQPSSWRSFEQNIVADNKLETVIERWILKIDEPP